MADSIVSCNSYHTSLSIPYFCVKPGTTFVLCSQTRFLLDTGFRQYDGTPFRIISNDFSPVVSGTVAGEIFIYQIQDRLFDLLI